LSNLAAGQFRMLMAELHAHESSQVTVEKLKWKNAHTSEAFKMNILFMEVAGLFGLQAEGSELCAVLSLRQLRSGHGLVFSATACVRVFFLWWW